jgi:tRNA modification GTPase
MDTIYALASGIGKSAIAVIRISGPATGAVLRRLTGRMPAARVATVKAISDPSSGELLDQGVVLWFPGPKSFTGEDSAELQIHGSRATVRALLRALSSQPELRLAGPGEFARRALANGKMDLIAIEALGDLIEAETEVQRRLAITASSGVLQDLVERLRRDVIGLMSLIEAELDFSDEGDTPTNLIEKLHGRIPALEATLRTLKSGHERAQLIRDGLTVVIAGPPNAGKSSLLNSLARRDVAIVSEYAGTTRDLIEVRLDLGGFPVNLIDTAGIRESLDPIEQIGISRALARSHQADLVLWLVPVDASDRQPPAELLRRPLWRVTTKIDLLTAPCDVGEDISLSVKQEGTIQGLIDRLREFADEAMSLDDSAVIANERQRIAADQALDALTDAGKQNLPPELVAENLRRVLFALESLIGKVGVEDVLDHLFSRFCIGK